MDKTLKRLLSIALALFLVIGLMPWNAASVYATEEVPAETPAVEEIPEAVEEEPAEEPAEEATEAPAEGFDEVAVEEAPVVAADGHTHNCEVHPNCTATWTAWDGDGEKLLNGGHFYLTETVDYHNIKSLTSGNDIVICLNGKTLNGPAEGRLFRVSNGTSLSIVDCTATGNEAEGTYKAGTIEINSNNIKGLLVGLYEDTKSTFNLYDGIIDGNGMNNTNAGATNGGVGGLITIENYNEVNIHGGVLKNCTAYRGGAVFIQHAGVLNMYDGLITGCAAVRGNAVAIGGAISTASTSWTMLHKDDIDPVFNMYGGKLSGNGTSGFNCYGTVALLQSGKATFNMSGGAITGNTIKNLCHGIHSLENGEHTINISGTAEISNNFGHGVLLDGTKDTLNISGGAIKNNYSPNQGTAIRVNTTTAVVNMSGGLITNNDCQGETSTCGGIVMNSGGTFNMTGGEIKDNTTSAWTGDGSEVMLNNANAVANISGTAKIEIGSDSVYALRVSKGSAKIAGAAELIGLCAGNGTAGTVKIYGGTFTRSHLNYVPGTSEKHDAGPWKEGGHEHSFTAKCKQEHTLLKSITAATCTKTGLGEVECSACGKIVDVIPATGEHSYTEFVKEVPATCTAGGYDVYKCATCEQTQKQNEVDALKHNYVDGKCSVCDEADPDYVAPAAPVAKVGDVEYTDIQEAIKAAAPSGTVELLSDVTVDQWKMVTTKTIATDQLITLEVNGMIIDGKGHTLTIKDVESASNGGYLFDDAANLTVQDLTIKCEGAFGGIGLKSGKIENVTFEGGNGVYPGSGNITIEDCTFKTTGVAVYFEQNRDNLVVTGNTFETAAGQYAIYLRGGVDFTNNTVISGKVNVTNSATGEISGNDFGTERFKVYNGATATISNNTINNLVFNDATVAKATFTDNTLSESAQAALNAVMPAPAYVAQIGEQGYATLQAAIEAAQASDKIVLLDNITLTEGVTVNGTVTLDLNGKTVTGEPAEAKAFAVITNKGNLTITGEGAIVCDHKLAGSTSYAVNTIVNAGTLTIENGVIENKSTAAFQIGYAIDNNSTSNDAVVVIKGGEVKASGSNYYDGIRLFCNSLTKQNSVTVEGGKVSTIWMQNPSDGAVKNTKDVEGNVTITGGNVGVLSLEPSSAFEASITGGYVGEVSYFQTAKGRDLTGFITGGAFGSDVSAFCAEGYVCEQNTDGTYGVAADSAYGKVAKIGNEYFATLADAVAAIATDGSDTTIKILKDIEVSESVVFNYGTGKVIFEADTPVTIKQTKVGLDFDLSKSSVAPIVIGKNVTFEIYDNAAGMYLYYGPSLELSGSITGGQNWGVLYLFQGEHNVSETGKIGTGRVQIGNTTLDVKGEVDTNYLLVENSTFTADGATVDANVIYDNNNGSQRWGASKFVIKNGSNVNTSKFTLSYAGSELTIDMDSVLTANTITGAGKIVIDAANYTDNSTCPIVGDASTFTGTVEVINNDSLEAKIVDGKIILVESGLKGSGTENDPFLIETVEDLILFRNSVNAGEGKYNSAYVKLMADIDLASVENWEPIGNVGYNSKYAPADATKIFSGVFDGNDKTISNLKMAKTAGGADEEANLGLFGITGEGAVIKNLTITNVNINTDGRNVGALVAFGYKATIDNITVNGNIQIKGGNNVSGVCAMTRHNAASVTNITVKGNDGSAIVGNNIVGGIFAEIAPNGAAQTFKNLSIENVAINGVGGVGGIVGLLTTGTVENVSVKNVALTGKTEYQGNAMGRIRLGSVAGLMGGKFSTIADATVENVTAKNLDGNAVVLPVIGANYDASSNATEAKIGDTYYATLKAAIDATQEGDIVLLAPIVVNAGETMVLDLKGKTVTGTDEGTASYGLITNKGNLTITGDGKITLSATNNRGWNAYSSVISNQPGGKLIVESGVIEHLGGTDMAYGIDNLTNGKGTYAETVINGGTVKSTYRAIRMFLNGIEAQNILTVNGGTIEGANKSIWMQDPSKNANTGTLTVGENATLNGDVYLTVTAGSTEWPVEVSIAAAAVNGEVLTSNVPEGYIVKKVNGNWTVKEGTYVAQIGEEKYETLAEAMAAAKTGDTVTILEGTYAMPAMKAGITVVGEGDVLLEGTLSGTLENLTLKNLHIKGANAQRWAYAKGDLVFENVTFEATSVYALHFDGIAEGTNLTYKNCTIIGWAAMGGSPASCTFEGCTIKDNGRYGVIRTYFDATIKDCTFDVANANTTDAYEDGIHAVEGAKVTVQNCTNVNGEMIDLVNVHATSVVVLDGVEIRNVAKIGDTYYRDLHDALTACKAGETVELIANVDLAGTEWEPVDFKGNFDGHEYKISNLVVNKPGTSDVGLFSKTSGKEIKNLTIENAKVTGRLNVGVVAGTPWTTQYTNIKVIGHVEVNGYAYVGGVGGKNAYANWTDITVAVDSTSYVKASSENYRTYVGGVVGFNGEGGHTFKNISSNIKVIGSTCDIGGLFGIAHYGNKFENVTFTGSVEAPEGAFQVGGIAGVWHNQKGQTVSFNNVTSTGTVTVGTETTTGSIVGGAYNASNETSENSGSLMIDGKEAWLCVAKIGDERYQTLAAALTAAQEGDTITVLAGTIEEGTIKMPASLKNVTIKGEEGAVLKDMTLMAHDGNTLSYVGLTIDGVVFDNSRISITGWRTGAVTVEDLKVINCTFKNLNDTTNSAPVHINMDADEAVKNFTFSKNVIDGATGGSKSGVYAQLTGEITFTDNVINNVSFRPYVIQITTDDGIADNFVVTGNTFSGSAAGRAQGLGNNNEGTDTVNLVVSGNIFKGITGAQQICYWNFNEETTTADLSKNYYDIDVEANANRFYYNSAAKNVEDLIGMGIYPYYADEAMTTLVTAPAIMITNADGSVEYYDTMAEAVPYTTNCPRLEGATVKLLTDIEAAGIRMMENDMVLDLNGHTYTIIAGTGSQGTNTSGFQIRPEVTTVATIKNGTIKVAEGAPVVWMFNVYATDFVVEDVTVDCANMAYSYGESCYVSVSRADDNVQFTGTTKVINFNANVAGNAINVGDTMTIGENVVPGGSIELEAGATLTAREGLDVVTAAPNKVVYVAGVYSVTTPAIEITNADGSVEYYDTMAEAVPYTTNCPRLEGATIKLLKDIEAAGIRMMENDMVLDLNDHTYTIVAGTGSQGTNTSGFQIRPEVTTVATIKNGTIKVAEGAPVVWMFNNYATNFVVENVTVDCTNMAYSYGESCYVYVSRTGDSAQFIGTTQILNFNSQVAGNAINVADTMTIGENVVPGGSIELEAGATLTAREGLDVTTSVAGGEVVYDNGVYSVKKGLIGEGTEANPFLIMTIEDLILFRDSVNAGETKYSAPGVYVALGADIDMAGINWVGIGTVELGFKGNFDGNGFKIKNLTITDPALDSDGYAYAGLFAVTEGAEGAENVIENLIIENVTISTNGHIVAAAIAYPYYTKVENVTVCGDINITGGDYTSGALAYTRRCVNASNVTVSGNAGSTITGNNTVGGVISDIQMNGGLTANYSNFKAENLTIKGNMHVGGISGIISKQTLNGATVKNVELVSSDARVGVVSGSLGDTSTITGVVIENVTGAVDVIGATYKDAAEVVAKIGDTYYATLQAAINATQEGDIVLLTPYVVKAGENVTLDLKGKTISGTHGAEYAMIHVQNGATLTINDSVGGGKITCAAGGNNIGANIWVEGALVQNGGTIEVTGAWTLGFAVDLRPNAWGTAHTAPASFVMNGGEIKSSDTAVRVASNSSDAYAEMGVNFTMNGGTISSTWDAIFVQHLYAGDLNIDIVDGTVSGANSVMRIYGDAGSDIAMNVKGGEFNGAIKVADAYANAKAIAITGGTYDQDPTAHVADGYKAVLNAESRYEIAKKPALFDIQSSSIVLGNELAMYFFVNKADLNGEDYIAYVTKTYADGRNDVTVEIPFGKWESRDDGRMRFKFDGIAAKEMGDDISVVIKNAEGTVLSNTYVDSIQKYVERGLDSGKATGELATMLVDMLNYGAAAQGIFTYDVEHPANANIGAYQDLATPSVALNNKQEKGNGFKSMSLVLESNISMIMFFDKAVVDQSMTAVVTFTDHYGKGHTIEVAGSNFENRGSKGWAIVINELVVADGCQLVKCEFKDANGNMIEGIYGIDSMESMCARAVAGGGGSWYEDIMKFSIAAYNYFH